MAERIFEGQRLGVLTAVDPFSRVSPAILDMRAHVVS